MLRVFLRVRGPAPDAEPAPLLADAVLSDEVYVNVAGQRVWGTYSLDEFTSTYSVGATKDLSGPAWNSYLGQIQIWDDDSSADDNLGTLNVYGNGSPSEVTGTYNFQKSGSNYSIEIGLRRI